MGEEPLRFTVHVKCPAPGAFRTFTEEIGSWWPVRTQFTRDPVVGMLLEGWAGGRISERGQNGETADWGRVLAWEPPQRIAFTWHPEGEEATEVEVQFIAEGSRATRVQLEHRGWERLGEEATERRTSCQHGWPSVLARYSGAALRQLVP
jgi:uncharacterized protein YndB with AHSA1/START domain